MSKVDINDLARQNNQARRAVETSEMRGATKEQHAHLYLPVVCSSQEINESLMIAGDVLRLTLVGRLSAEPLNNVYHVRLGFVSDPAITPAQFAEAIWNHIKAAQRNVACTTWTTAYTEILAEQVDVPAGLYGTFPIPAGEQAGTRAAGTPPSDAVTSSFISMGMRLNVPSRLTRPGQKRLWGLTENDLTGFTVAAAAVAAAANFGALLDDNIVLGVPAALSEVRFVIRAAGPDDVPQVNQFISSVSVSPNVRSQVSRRIPAF